MSNVYFKEIKDYNNTNFINDSIYEIMEKIVKEENIIFEGTVPLKVHFGEKGNTTYITPDKMDGIKRYLTNNNLKSLYIESNVLYKGARTLSEDHIALAKEHGFDDMDIVIADCEEGNEYSEVEINKEFFKKCKIASKYLDYKNYIVISHFKGHGLAGFGGAIKQLAMGFASRAGKLHQHSNVIPIISEDKCISCGACVEKCPVDAIYLDDCAKINSNKCIGCASCSIVCPVNAIYNSWDTNNFQEKIAEYAYAASLDKNNIYITYAFNITQECDCVSSNMKPIFPNIGIFVSTDPLAIDMACYDMFKKINNTDKFNKGEIVLEHAKKINLGSKDYKIIEL